MSIFDIFNYLTWLVFIYLGYRTLLIVVASVRQRRRFRTQDAAWRRAASELARDLRLEHQRVLRRAGTVGHWQLGLIQNCRRLAGEQTASDRPAMLYRIVTALIRGQDSLAEQLHQGWRESLVGSANNELHWGDQAQRVGLFGTVLGIWQAFQEANGNHGVSMVALAVALGTTAVGLVIAMVIQVTMAVVFRPAADQLRRTMRDRCHGFAELIAAQRLEISLAAQRPIPIDAVDDEAPFLPAVATASTVI